MTRIPVAMAGLALVAATVVACGSDDGDDTTADDPAASSTPSTSTSPDTASDSPSASDSTADSGDPVFSPIINKAVKPAIADGFPALVPAGVPAGWTVLSAAYKPQGGGEWTIDLTDPNGAPVTVLQSTAPAADLMARLLPDGQAGGTVKVSGTGKWTAYTGTAGAGLAKELPGTGAVVVGSDVNVASDLAQVLLTAEDAGNGDGG